MAPSVGEVPEMSFIPIRPAELIYVIGPSENPAGGRREDKLS